MISMMRNHRRVLIVICAASVLVLFAACRTVTTDDQTEPSARAIEGDDTRDLSDTVLPASATTAGYRLTWNDDPATTMMIGWDQISGEDPVVYYGKKDFGTEWKKYTTSCRPTNINRYMGMHNHFAQLSGLEPDTMYYFLIKDTRGISKRMSFKTAPAESEPFTFISGVGARCDNAAGLTAHYSLPVVGKLKPLFVIVNIGFGDRKSTRLNSSHYS